ncbi:MAG: IPTL-CTERM sorting domain-containing protein [Comamonadaceae bacterium]|nr:MAG: IPTL-CTERM sorting domain-containing protein [Comamonadaceae bacterium]
MEMNTRSLLLSLALGALSSVGMAQNAPPGIYVPPGGSFDTSAFGSSLDLGCTSVLVEGALAVGSSTVLGATDVVVSGGNVTGDSGIISLSGTFDNSGTFSPGTGTVEFVDSCAAGDARIVGATSFTNLSFVSTTGRRLVIPNGTTITVTGTLTLQGAPGAPISIVTANGAPAIINLAPGATVVRSNVTLQPGVTLGAPLAASVAAIPTLSEYGLMLLSALVGLFAFANRRRFNAKEKNAFV